MALKPDELLAHATSSWKLKRMSAHSLHACKQARLQNALVFGGHVKRSLDGMLFHNLGTCVALGALSAYVQQGLGTAKITGHTRHICVVDGVSCAFARPLRSSPPHHTLDIQVCSRHLQLHVHGYAFAV